MPRIITRQPTPPPDDNTPLGEVRDWLLENREDGVFCPCCTQFAKVYKRVLPRATALVMIRLWRVNEGRDYRYLPPVLDTMTGTAAQGGYGTFGHHWDLMKQAPGLRADGSNRVGWWRLTALGREFVVGDIKVNKYAHIYNNRCLRLSGPPWSIKDALGSKFNYDELMGW